MDNRTNISVTVLRDSDQVIYGYTVVVPYTGTALEYTLPGNGALSWNLSPIDMGDTAVERVLDELCDKVTPEGVPVITALVDYVYAGIDDSSIPLVTASYAVLAKVADNRTSHTLTFIIPESDVVAANPKVTLSRGPGKRGSRVLNTMNGKYQNTRYSVHIPDVPKEARQLLCELQGTSWNLTSHRKCDDARVSRIWDELRTIDGPNGGDVIDYVLDSIYDSVHACEGLSLTAASYSELFSVSHPEGQAMCLVFVIPPEYIAHANQPFRPSAQSDEKSDE